MLILESISLRTEKVLPPPMERTAEALSAMELRSSLRWSLSSLSFSMASLVSPRLFVPAVLIMSAEVMFAVFIVIPWAFDPLNGRCALQMLKDRGNDICL